jgi:hypothetical protein
VLGASHGLDEIEGEECENSREVSSRVAIFPTGRRAHRWQRDCSSGGRERREADNKTRGG